MGRPRTGQRASVEIVAAASGDTRGEYDGVASLYLPIALVVVAIVFGAVAFAIVRYRVRAGHREAKPTSEHKALEIGVGTVIAIVAAVLIATTFASEGRIEATTPKPDVRVDVTAFRWGWRFAYPDLGGVADVSREGRPAVLRVPQGALVSFGMTSRDVIHSFWLPELRFKRDAFPYRRESFDLRFPDKATILGGHCSFFCGLKHSDMGFSVLVMPRPDFDRWVAQQRGGGA